MSDNGLAMLGDMLAANTKIERLSLCGSCIGNHGLVVGLAAPFPPLHQGFSHAEPGPRLRLQMLKEGLGANKSLRELDLTGCSLTDLGAKVVASILKVISMSGSRCARCSLTGRHCDDPQVHSTARSDLFWREMLREYPNANEGKMKQRIFERTKMQIMSRVNVTEGGLLLLEMRENKVKGGPALLDRPLLPSQ